MSQTVVVTNTTSNTTSALEDTDDAINEAELILCNGCLCCNQTLYTTMPGCVGCSAKNTCCCCVEQVCCKLGTPPLLCSTPEGDICQLGCGCCSVGCKQPATCIAVQSQMCCIVQGCAFPTNGEIPITCACWGCACYPKPGCCATLGDLTGITTIHTTTTIVVSQGSAAQVTPAPAPMQAPAVIPSDVPSTTRMKKMSLELYWNSERQDNFCACQDDAKRSALDANYVHIREDCRIRRKHKGGSIPLKTFWHGGRQDNITVCHPDTLQSLQDCGGYSEIRTEGYVYDHHKSGTIPLKLYWNAARQDNMSCAHPHSQKAAEDAGYTFIRTEGYVFPSDDQESSSD